MTRSISTEVRSNEVAACVLDETFAEAIKTVIPFEERLNIKKGFYIELLLEKDDCSFIIKLHALVEAALSHLLAGSQLRRIARFVSKAFNLPSSLRDRRWRGRKFADAEVHISRHVLHRQFHQAIDDSFQIVGFAIDAQLFFR